MPYFDVTDADDDKLIHPSVKLHPELENMATIVERRVIAQFQERDDDDVIQVMLTGYDADPAQAAADVKQALKDAIAAVLNYTLLRRDYVAGVRSESLGNYSVAYWSEGSSLGAGVMVPPGWDEPLRIFDTRTAPWWA